MRKSAVILVLVALVAAASFAGPAEAGKKKKKPKRVERTVEVTYEGLAVGVWRRHGRMHDLLLGRDGPG